MVSDRTAGKNLGIGRIFGPMSEDLDPIVGNWYRHLDKGQLFTVVSVDDESKLVELQHFDGDIEEIELADWSGMTLELSEAPEDWTGPIDDVARDDTGYSEAQMSGDNWREPLEDTPREAAEAWQDKGPEDERDDWAEGASTEEARRPDGLENDLAASVAPEESEEESSR